MGTKAARPSPADDGDLASLEFNLSGIDTLGALSLEIRGTRQGSENGDVVGSNYLCEESFSECIDLGASGQPAAATLEGLCPSKDVPFALWDFSFFLYSGPCSSRESALNPAASTLLSGDDPFPNGFACYDASLPNWLETPNETQDVELLPGSNTTHVICIKAASATVPASP